MKAFETSIENIIYRFGLMMAVIIITFIVGIPAWALLAVPIFLSAMLGIQFKSDKGALKKLSLKKTMLRQNAA